MKVTRNEDGTVTVSIPKADEVYDPVDGQLYIEETMGAEDFKSAVAKHKKDPEEPES
jgi:hypothetical protein